MANIVYVLTNTTMPGIVKIGITDRDDVRQRMGELYTTGVPLPFECARALEVADREAREVEDALHSTFARQRINPSREFFQLEPDEYEKLFAILPGRDVTPQNSGPAPGVESEDRAALSSYKAKQKHKTETAFLKSFTDSGVALYRRVLAIGEREGMQINWANTAFSLNVASRRGLVKVCTGWQPGLTNTKSLYTEFQSIRSKSGVPEDTLTALREEALETGFFVQTTSRYGNVAWPAERELDEGGRDILIGWLEKVIATVIEHPLAEADDS